MNQIIRSKGTTQWIRSFPLQEESLDVASLSQVYCLLPKLHKMDWRYVMQVWLAGLNHSYRARQSTLCSREGSTNWATEAAQLAGLNHSYKEALLLTKLSFSLLYLTQKPGDEIVRVNGLTLCQATNEEVVNLIKLKKTLLLTCKSELHTYHCYVPV